MPEHRERLRVRWVDTDASGRIHFTAAFRYFEIAEFELLRAVGVPYARTAEVDFPRVNVAATFKRQLTVDDIIEVRIRPARVGGRSVTYRCEVYHEGELAIEGQVTAVAVGPDGKSRSLPEALRRALTS
jgi:YbgC/YbaW family acyl-CoA thioester hydrolase